VRRICSPETAEPRRDPSLRLSQSAGRAYPRVPVPGLALTSPFRRRALLLPCSPLGAEGFHYPMHDIRDCPPSCWHETRWPSLGATNGAARGAHWQGSRSARCPVATTQCGPNGWKFTHILQRTPLAGSHCCGSEMSRRTRVARQDMRWAGESEGILSLLGCTQPRRNKRATDPDCGGCVAGLVRIRHVRN
jgi:hypothetical protein